MCSWIINLWTYTCFLKICKTCLCFTTSQQLDDEDIAKLLFEDIETKLWNFMWNEYKGKLDEFIDVLFLVYCVRCQPNIKEWLIVDMKNSESLDS